MGEQVVEQFGARVARLEAAISDLDQRLRAVESAPLRAAASAVPAGAGPDSGPDVQLQESDLVGTLSLVGRTFVVSAGAYLLRALTESGTVPAAAGVLAGLAYAALWAVVADRAARVSRASATFHAGASVFIAFPLLWEAQARFGLVSPAGSAVGVGVLTAVLLALAWRRHLHVVAWLVTGAGLVTAVGLLVLTHVISPFAAYLLALGIATLWLGYDRGWIALRWPVAVAANLAVLGLTSRALHPDRLESAGAALSLQLLLPAAYLCSIAARTLWLGRNVIPFEVVQTAAALGVGLGGAFLLVTTTGVGGTALGLAMLALGTAGYAVAFAFVDHRQGRGANFYFYTSLGLSLVVAGVWVLVPPAPRALTMAALAVCAAWAGSRYSRTTLITHAAVCLVVGASTAGVLSTSWTAFVGSADVPIRPATLVCWAIVAAAATALRVGHCPGVLTWSHPARAPRTLIAVVLVVCAGGLALAILAPLFAGDPAQGLPAGTLATLRTSVLAVSALALAALSRRVSNVELGSLVYPALIVGGVKLLFEDFRLSPPPMLVVAFALYGAALILAPRMRAPAPHASAPRVKPDVHAQV